MAAEHAAPFVELLNAQLSWTTDESMLLVVPADSRSFEGGGDWPKLKALTYLANNAASLRRNFEALEAGESPDLAELNPVIESAQIRCERRGAALTLAPRPDRGRWNPATASIRHAVQAAFLSFVVYADYRVSDPKYPGFSMDRFRVAPCGAATCGRLTGTLGLPRLCRRCDAAKGRPA